MEQAVAPCPEVNLKAKGTEFKSLLDFGSMVSLINESFFGSKLASLITPMAGDNERTSVVQPKRCLRWAGPTIQIF